MFDCLVDTFIDALKLFPFLWVAFLVIELLEHKFYDKTRKILKGAGRFGPILGGLLGCFPSCGFSVAVTNLYVTRIITMGTLVSVYLSTSDEMLPLLLAHGTDTLEIVQLVLIKLLVGIIAGIVIDLFFSSKGEVEIEELCHDEHCHCDKGIFKSSLVHVFNTLIFIMVVSFFLNLVMYYGGNDFLSSLFNTNRFIAPFIASVVGLIPNCAASVIITELYLSGMLSMGSAISGLLTGSGVAGIVLFKMNRDKKECFKILFILYVVGVLVGVLFEGLSLIL